MLKQSAFNLLLVLIILAGRSSEGKFSEENEDFYYSGLKERYYYDFS
ncbi:hypothetical protein [Lysinibacillus xylanilyticus]